MLSLKNKTKVFLLAVSIISGLIFLEKSNFASAQDFQSYYNIPYRYNSAYKYNNPSQPVHGFKNFCNPQEKAFSSKVNKMFLCIVGYAHNDWDGRHLIVDDFSRFRYFKVFIPPVKGSINLMFYNVSTNGFIYAARLGEEPDENKNYNFSTHYRPIESIEETVNGDAFGGFYTYGDAYAIILDHASIKENQGGWLYLRTVYGIPNGSDVRLAYTAFDYDEYLNWYNNVPNCGGETFSDSVCWDENGDPVVLSHKSDPPSSEEISQPANPEESSTNSDQPIQPIPGDHEVSTPYPAKKCSQEDLSSCISSSDCLSVGGVWKNNHCQANSAHDPHPVAISFSNPIGTDEITSLFQSIIQRIQSIVAILVILFLILSGIFYLTSAGNEKRINLAKEAFVASLVGFTLVLAAPSFLKQIKEIIFPNSDSIPTNLDQAPSLSQIIQETLSFLLSIFGVLAIISFIISAFIYLSSLGNSQRAEQAKKSLTYSIIGVAISLGSLILVRQILAWF
jgi:hypothetical protein